MFSSKWEDLSKKIWKVSYDKVTALQEKTPKTTLQAFKIFIN